MTEDMAAQPTASSSHFFNIIPTIRKEHERRVKISTSSPFALLSTPVDEADDDDDDDDLNKTRRKRCLVCQKHEARYTCPRCEIPYCSLECYRVHGNNDNNVDSAQDLGDGSSSDVRRSCTEAFYQDRVSSVVNLEVKEQAENTRHMIQKVYEEQQEQLDEPEDISQDQLLSILRALEKQESPEELQALVCSLSPNIQQSLDYAVRNGHVQEWLIEPWHPWWKSELTPVNADSQNGTTDDNDCDNDAVLNNGGRTLDDRLLEEIPCFAELKPKEHKSRSRNSQPADVDLRFNLVDILYGVVSTLCLFNGVNNASCRDNSTEAAEALIQSSLVLSKDARWSHLEQVLTSICCTPSPRDCFLDVYNSRETSSTAMSNEAILREVALILNGNFRMVARALLEGMDILRCSIATTEERESEHGHVQRSKSTRKMKRLGKKMEYFLSWSKQQQQQPSFFSSLATGIEGWLADWNTGRILTEPS